MQQFIGIAGNIGAGKTTLTGLLAERFDWDAHYESVVDNPYLEDFYADKDRWGFHLQVYFLQHRFRSLQKLQSGSRSAIQDRTIWEDANIFARNLHELGHINERDWATYQSLFAGMEHSLPRPTLLIYLQASLDTLLTRIRRRARHFEERIDPQYLLRLNLAYEHWVTHWTLCPVLVINADRNDLVSDPDCFESVVIQVDEILSQRQLGLGLGGIPHP
ncbi:MAG: deoxynucleoside kinase [Calditrichaeota bacterium]|nr:deoxynucleoside kinase [Candidatus Cloacimonadota bacterium]MCA9785300.1 deoxynucleoside kinase [Candidatus Cloacimonadota bacterium]MCB1047751.1 deoxynucleoside kinase [Calditrichota bacterium]MCB9474537.1 deoxynucleoside kinase [Candidatus Delongbacteria bacterium]